MLECVVNISEGRDRRVIEAVAAAGAGCLLDVHSDPHHHRSVLTLAGREPDLEESVRAVAVEGVRRIDLRVHAGAHPRLGAVDVVPFVPLAAASFATAVDARDRFAAWAAAHLGVPCFRYGPDRPAWPERRDRPAWPERRDRTLPDIRRQAFVDLAPDTGPATPHPTAGAICVGARRLLIAYNLWLAPGTSLETARRVAAGLRSPAVRSLGLQVGERVQVSLNLVDPPAFGPAAAYDAVAARAPVERAELVGLLPATVLQAIPSGRWPALGLDAGRTIEGRLRLG